MDLRLAGKRALVTGSSAGLGEAIAKLLAAEGVGIVVHGRDEGRTNAVAEAIRADGGRADVALGDLSTDAGADARAEGLRRHVECSGSRRHSGGFRREPPGGGGASVRLG